MELVAPRPLRVAAPVPFRLTHQRQFSAKSASPPLAETLSRMMLAESEMGRSTTPPARQEQTDGFENAVERSSTASPLSSARLLPTEALEEFLSILRPNMFMSPSSPISRYTRHQHRQSASQFISAASPSPTYERPGHHPYRVPRSASRAASRASDDAESALNAKRNRSRSGSLHPSMPDEERWHTSVVLSSPISRAHAVNPLPRDPAYENLTHNFTFRFASRTPSPALALSTGLDEVQLPTETVC